MSSRPSWFTERVSGQSGGTQRKPVLQNKTKQKLFCAWVVECMAVQVA